jgi:hypothetical protein
MWVFNIDLDWILHLAAGVISQASVSENRKNPFKQYEGRKNPLFRSFEVDENNILRTRGG